jgi:hypothetical protein
MQTSEYLGNFSQHPFRSVSFDCTPCGVSWTGCAAAADCPRCGRGYDWHDPAAPPTQPDLPCPYVLNPIWVELQAQVDFESSERRRLGSHLIDITT